MVPLQSVGPLDFPVCFFSLSCPFAVICCMRVPGPGGARSWRVECEGPGARCGGGEGGRGAGTADVAEL